VAKKEQKFFSHSFGGWKSEIRVSSWMCCGEGLLLGCRFIVLHGSKRGRELSGLFYKGTNLIQEDSTHTA
jgi:hypothetical protein